ncbi:unnamed protein product [Enterobius vermicularis]|uniref:Vacuolar protein sorting-associated protein 16 homolog n=1 Tax=Enterobius vermicularis TaxID=51028 RepID=A0A0N4VBN3_ENTVE|nr:unnamed protein product [Enterobius vermicularis]
MDSITVAPVKVRLNTLYEKIDVGWKDTSLFAASPYGGPIAIANCIPGSISHWTITVKTCAGVTLASIKTEIYALHALYWTRCHRLVVLSKRGHVHVYTPLGKRVAAHHFAQETPVIQSRSFTSSHSKTGVAILAETNYIYLANSVMDFAVWRLPQAENRQRPSVWNVLSPATFGQVTVICIVNNNFYIGVQGFPPQSLNVSWKLTEGSYLDACSSWDSSLIAFCHSSLDVQIANSDFTLLYTIKLPDSLLVDSICASSSSSKVYWCGSQAILFKYSKNSLLVSSLESNRYEFFFGGDIRLDMELDGVKVFTEHELSLITIVPEEVENVLGLLSQQCGALLFAASEKFQSRGTGVYDYINMIGPDTEKAVHQCLFAAAHQFDCALQQKLLLAANLGKSLTPQYDSSQFVDTCRVMRILNCIRQPYVGIAMSFSQSTELKMDSLIDRLIDLNHWPLAIKFCDYMHVEPNVGVHRVLAHWAVSKIEDAKKRKDTGSVSDYNALAELIVSKFSSFPDVSFADVAREAVNAGLNDLAVLLLEKETHLDRRVKMLLSLNKIEMALKRAAKSQQPDLLHVVVNYLRTNLRKDEVDRLLHKHPQALSLYQDFLRDTSPQHVLALYKEDDDFARQAICHLEEAEFVPWNPFEKKQKVDELCDAKRCMASLKETGIEQVLDDSSKLLEICDSLEDKNAFSDIDRTSLRSVVVWAFGRREEDSALIEMLKRKFKLSDRVCMMWKIEGYAKYGKWHHLENLSKVKKMPVGIMPFVEACVRYGNNSLGEQLVNRLSSPEEVVEAFISLGLPEKAASKAVENKLSEYVDIMRSQFRADEIHGPEVLRILNAYRKM